MPEPTDFSPTVIPDAPSSASGPPAELRFRSGSLDNQSFPLTDGATLGRSAQNTIGFNDQVDQLISGRHARIRLDAGRWVLEDLGSTNGTFVNGQPLTQAHTLMPGDTIQFGGLSGPGTALAEYVPHTQHTPVPSSASKSTRPAAPSNPSTPPATPPAPQPTPANQDPSAKMDFALNCPLCGAPISAPMSKVGRRHTCPRCEQSFRVPLPKIGLFGKPNTASRGEAKGRDAKAVQIREWKDERDAAKDRLQKAKDDHRAAFVALGEAVVEGDLLDDLGEPHLSKLQAFAEQRTEARAELARQHEALDEVKNRHETEREEQANALAEAKQLDAERETGLEEADKAVVKAAEAVRASLAAQADLADQLADRFKELGAAWRQAPETDPSDELASAKKDAAAMTKKLWKPVDGLDKLIADHQETVRLAAEATRERQEAADQLIQLAEQGERLASQQRDEQDAAQRGVEEAEEAILKQNTAHAAALEACGRAVMVNETIRDAAEVQEPRSQAETAASQAAEEEAKISTLTEQLRAALG
ncbi:MAG: FHA domain-containing protein [Planctomycetota bacterium]